MNPADGGRATGIMLPATARQSIFNRLLAALKRAPVIPLLILMTVVLSAFLILNGWVGWTRLASLNERTQRLGTQTFSAASLASDVRSELLTMARMTQNALAADSAEEVKPFAEASAASADAIAAATQEILTDVTDPGLRTSIGALQRNIE